jgi:hypothetical protein
MKPITEAQYYWGSICINIEIKYLEILFISLYVIFYKSGSSQKLV